jgi:hypothetical protein
MTDSVLRSKQSLAARVAACMVLALAVACDDFTGVPASLSTVTDSGTVYALNGAPPGAPTALHLYTASRQPADASFLFDIAFDINPAGDVVILPLRTVASGLASSHSVGLQHVQTEFSLLDRAPKSGYRPDTAFVTRAGQTIAIQSSNPNICGVSITGTAIYAKLIILSTNVSERKMSIQYTVDPNCGFLSFSPGVPKD